MRGKNIIFLFQNWMVLVCKVLNPLKPGMLCAKSSWNLNFVKVFSLFYIISPWKRAWYFFEQTRIPFIQEWCVPSLVEIDQKVLEIKDFLNFVSVFSLGKKGVALHLNKFKFSSPKNAFCRVEIGPLVQEKKIDF